MGMNPKTLEFERSCSHSHVEMNMANHFETSKELQTFACMREAMCMTDGHTTQHQLVKAFGVHVMYDN